MKIAEVNSFDDLMEKIKEQDRSVLLLFKKGSEQSECSLKNLQELKDQEIGISVFTADVSHVRDIHEKYHITSVPVMLEFEKGRFINVLKGCHKPDFYKSFFENAVYSARAGREGEIPQKRVTVYSTPTCSWCNTLKTHLKKNGIRYTDIDVSRDQNAAQEMQRKSGQMGVPQTDINGEVIVGFDKTRINNLLGIQQA
ncbi:MAG: glutaredoxin family protein [Bacteroidales bacterium]|nr:glutaredoxin family protein [Bacteroidales bacterium]